VTQYAEEPTIANRVSLETRSGEEWLPHKAMIADLTRHEVWVGVDEHLGELLDPGRPVRLVLRRPDGVNQTGETIVLWHIGRNGQVVVLMRPTMWDPPSKRAHSRAWLAIPAYLRPVEDAPPVSAQTTNVGVGGFHCLSDVSLEVGQKVSVSLRLSPVESFDCKAEVVRLDANPDDPTGRQSVLAFHFVDLPEDEQAALATSLTALAEDVDENFVPRVWREAEAARADA